MLKYLRGGERTVGELAEQVGISRTALAHHLMVLKRADCCRQFQMLGCFSSGSLVVTQAVADQHREETICQIEFFM